MYDNYEGTSSLNVTFKGLFVTVVIVGLIYLVYLFIIKLKQRKITFIVSDILKLIWMIASVIILILMMSLFFPEFSIDVANKKFTELLPFRKGLLGALTGLISAFLVSIFCLAGIGTYFEKLKRN